MLRYPSGPGFGLTKGQLISKANCQAVNFSKKRTNEFVFITMRRVFVCFLEEIEDSKKAFRNYLTFSMFYFLLLYRAMKTKQGCFPKLFLWRIESPLTKS